MGVKNSSENIDLDSIRYILTLRYNPHLQSSLPFISPIEYSSTDSEPNLEYLERLFENNIKKMLSGADNICIALSGGVDSTLVLALIKKFYPDQIGRAHV